MCYNGRSRADSLSLSVWLARSCSQHERAALLVKVRVGGQRQE